MNEDVCIIFDFHIWNDFVSFNFERFKDAAEGLCELIPAYHQKNKYMPDIKDNRLLVFTDIDVFDCIPHRKDNYGMVVPGNCDLSFLAICRKIPKYKTYIRIEYDVVAIADPRIALEFLVSTAQGYDLGGSFFGGGYGDEWKWWPSLAPPENVTLDLTKSTKRAFFPIMSISKTFISTYEAALAAGWKGHFEVLAPTIALLSKSTTVDFSLTQPKITRFPQFQVAAPEEVNAGICYYVHPVKSFTEYSKIIDV